jgi:hypothetical protein
LSARTGTFPRGRTIAEPEHAATKLRETDM